jgi:bifunctional non-homologous end joining protein LigD
MAKVVGRADLFCKAGSKDAVYHMEIVETEGGYLVNYRNGRAGGTLASGSKTPKPLATLEAAQKVMEKTVKEKLKASPPYQLMESAGSSFTEVQADVAQRSTGLLPQLLNEVDIEDTAAVEAFIKDDFYCMEQKADGERRMLRSLGDGSVPIGSNRKGGQVPLPQEIAISVAQAPTCAGSARRTARPSCTRWPASSAWGSPCCRRRTRPPRSERWSRCAG